jgi:hypothetical protein
MTEPNLIGGLAGGALIGTASVLLLALTGRIAGISGILGGLVIPAGAGDRAWRTAFLAGLAAGAAAYAAFTGRFPFALQAHGAGLVIAGLLVGAGTRLGGGCTSGHGICGLARRSLRSLVATASFIAAGMLTVFVSRHLLS